MASRNEIRRNLETLSGSELDAYIAAHPEAAREYNRKAKEPKKSTTSRIMDYIRGVKENNNSHEM